jgi:thiol-disulfide isomerase/thioredoxin
MALAGPQLGDAAPSLDLTTISGAPPARASATQPTVVAFFASWCEPCKQNLDDLRAVREELGPHFRLVIVATDRDLPRLRAYFADHAPPVGAIVLLDSDGRAAQQWGETRLPTTFFLDRGGIVRHINRGHGSGFHARATRWLQAMFDDA